MAARPSWEGHLRLSLGTSPVALWPATSEADTVRFKLINPKTNNCIRMQTVDAGTGPSAMPGDASGRARAEGGASEQRRSVISLAAKGGKPEPPLSTQSLDADYAR